MQRLLFLLILIICAHLLFSCSVPEEAPKAIPNYSRPLAQGENALVKIPEAKFPDFKHGYRNLARLSLAVDQSIEYMHKPSSEDHFPVQGITHDRVLRSLQAFKDHLHNSKSAEEFSQKIRQQFDVYKSVGWDKKGTVLFTGYCEPIIDASLTKTPVYKFPLYRLPEDLVKNQKGDALGRRTAAGGLVPYYTRQEIDQGQALRGRDLELAWVKDPLDAYIVHVQGSATLKLRNGEEKKIGYAGKNSRPYQSLGQALVKEGKIEAHKVSLDAIRNYFDQHPKELMDFLYRNQSYIFFTEHEGGPYGSIGAEVTAYNTIATDKSVFPRAALSFIDTKIPAKTKSGKVLSPPYKGFALDQDTGGAIRSAGRVDVFLGTGHKAEFLAGRTCCEGALYYLFLRQDMM